MAAYALVLYVFAAVLTFGIRAYLQWRRTGSTGLVGFASGGGVRDASIGLGFVAAIVAGIAGPLLDLLGVIEPVSMLEGSAVGAVGVLLAGLGILATFAAQLAMGDSWRVGVASDERTELVTDGPFRVVRNPIFTAMIVMAVGLALMVPNAVALGGVALLVLSLELHVRLIEEPYLLGVHGQPYEDYARSTGRFLPWIGRAGGSVPVVRRGPAGT